MTKKTADAENSGRGAMINHEKQHCDGRRGENRRFKDTEGNILAIAQRL